MGDFCEKSHFSPLKSWKYLNIAKKSEKKRLAGPGLGGRGCHQGEKNFFAFLDKSDHLQAKKKILIVGGKWRSFFIIYAFPKKPTKEDGEVLCKI